MTGAGRGIGRAYARLLAARGARVVVNDLGGSMEGTGEDAQPAQHVVDEIVNDGGTAVTDNHDVSTTAGAAATVATALEAVRACRRPDQQRGNHAMGGHA